VLRKMTHTRSRSAYFKSAKLLEFEPRDFEYRVFLEKYAAFVLDRFACFSGRFGESPMLGSTSDPRRLVASLKTMGRILDKAIQVVNAHERISNGVTLQCTELIVRDCFLARNKRESLWQVFCNTLAQLLSNQQQHGLVEENLARNTQHLLKWTLRVSPAVRALVNVHPHPSHSLSQENLDPSLDPSEAELWSHLSWMAKKKRGALVLSDAVSPR